MARSDRLAWLIACGFGSGLAPRAPGTFGSLLGLGIGGVVLWTTGSAAGGVIGLLAAAAAATLAGLWAIVRVSDGDDHGWIVIDEIAGQLLAMLPLAGLAAGRDMRVALIGGVMAFVLFRLFDITKPGPVGWADRQHGGAGIMGDDLLAGLGAAIVLAGLRWLAAHWGGVA